VTRPVTLVLTASFPFLLHEVYDRYDAQSGAILRFPHYPEKPFAFNY